MRNKIIFIDYQVFVHKAGHASVHNPGIPVSYSILNMIFSTLCKIGVDDFTTIVLGTDAGKSWRKKREKSYKGDRKAKKEQSGLDWDDIYKQANWLYQRLIDCTDWQECQYHWFEYDEEAKRERRWGLEADDLCIRGTTYIASPKKPTLSRMASKMKVGDPVYTYNEHTGQIEIKRINKVMTRQTRETYKVHFENNTSLQITGNHPVYRTDDTWVKVEDLKVGDEIYYLNSFTPNRYIHNGKKITKIEKIHHRGTQPVKVFNFEIEGNNNYFANNLLIHNCAMLPKYFKETDIIIVSVDADLEQLFIYNYDQHDRKVYIYSPRKKNDAPYKKIMSKDELFKLKSKKIEKEVSDNLTAEINTDEDYERRQEIVDLMSLPKWIEDIAFNIFSKFEQKEIDYEGIPFKSIRARWDDMYKSDRVITYEASIALEQKREARKKKAKDKEKALLKQAKKEARLKAKAEKSKEDK